MIVWWKGREIEVPEPEKEGIKKNGYHLVYRPTHPSARSKGYVRAHILVAEQMIERPLKSTEEVHHRNRDRLDNHPDNLVVEDKGKHRREHARSRSRPRTMYERIMERRRQGECRSSSQNTKTGESSGSTT